MDLFSISQLQRFSGIKAHTIRIWEQRYNALSPNRSEGNTRYYDNSQLRRLLNIVSLMESDYKVSELCAMPDKKLFDLISDQLAKKALLKEESDYFVSQLIAASMSYDEAEFDKVLSVCFRRMEMRDAYVKVIYPLLDRIGLMWTTDTMPPAREHFISNLLRQKLIAAINTLPHAGPQAKPWLLFLPEGEFHELGLLFAHYLLRSSGNKVFYLGANVPFETLVRAVKDIPTTNLLFFLVHYNEPADMQDYIERLTKSVQKANIYLSGNARLISALKTDKKIQWLRSVDDLEKIIL